MLDQHGSSESLAATQPSLEAFELCPSQGIHWRAADSGRADSNLLVADLQMLLEGMIQCHRMPQIS